MYRDGNLEIIVKAEMMAGHVFDRTVHTFSSRDGLFVKYITHTDYIIGRYRSNAVIEPGNYCQDIEVNHEFMTHHSQAHKKCKSSYMYISLYRVLYRA